MNYKRLGYQLRKQADVVKKINLGQRQPLARQIGQNASRRIKPLAAAYEYLGSKPLARQIGQNASLRIKPLENRSIAPYPKPGQPFQPYIAPKATMGPGRDSSGIFTSGGHHDTPVMRPRTMVPQNSTYNPNAADWMAKWYSNIDRRFQRNAPLPSAAAPYMFSRTKKVMSNAMKRHPNAKILPSSGGSYFSVLKGGGSPRIGINTEPRLDKNELMQTTLHEGIHANAPDNINALHEKNYLAQMKAKKQLHDISKQYSASLGPTGLVEVPPNPGGRASYRRSTPADQENLRKALYDKKDQHNALESQRYGMVETPTVLGESVARARSKMQALKSSDGYRQVIADTALEHQIPYYAAEAMVNRLPKTTDKNFVPKVHAQTLTPRGQNFFLHANKEFPHGVHPRYADPMGYERHRRAQGPTNIPTRLAREAHMNPEAIKFMKDMNMQFSDAPQPSIPRYKPGTSAWVPGVSGRDRLRLKIPYKPSSNEDYHKKTKEMLFPIRLPRPHPLHLNTGYHRE